MLIFYHKTKAQKAFTQIYINICNPLKINIAKDKIKYLINMSKYFSKGNKVKKYWLNISEVGKLITYKEGVDILRYAL